MGNSTSTIDYQSIPENLLDVPLIKWQVFTSHNSYLRDVQHLTVCSAKNVVDSMKVGSRCILLDIYYVNSKFVIAHGDGNNPTTIPVSLQECLDAIVLHAFEFTTDPLIIMFEVCSDSIHNLELSNKIRETLGQLLLSPNQLDSSVWQTPIGNLRNKIMVISDANLPIDIDLTSESIGVHSNISSNVFKEKIAAGTLNPNTRWYSTWQSDNLLAAFGHNYDPSPMLEAGCQAVSMNVLVNDSGMKKYKSWFDNHGFKLLSI